MTNREFMPESRDQATLSRRAFTALALATGMSVTRSAAATMDAPRVVDVDVRVPTPAGMCDAAVCHRDESGSWPAVIMYPDIFGLRPVTREMARRLASDGYVVVVPNIFYRSTAAPGLGPTFDFSNPADRAQLDSLRAPLTADAIAQDAAAFVDFLDHHPSVDTHRKIGVFGYCFGGQLTMRAAAAAPTRVGAAAVFHGGNGLATDTPDSPHLLIPKMTAKFYCGVAGSDDDKDPSIKTKLANAFQSAHLDAEIEVYKGAEHGWCMKDAHATAGHPVYNAVEAERAWGKLVRLFKQVLVLTAAVSSA